MPTGRELDILMEEEVMGCAPCDKWTPVLYPEAGWIKNCQCEACYPAGEPAHYSTNIAVAWQAVEKTITGTTWECYLTHQFDGWSCLFAAPDKLDAHGVGASAPLAICRAALRAVGVSNDNFVSIEKQSGPIKLSDRLSRNRWIVDEHY